MQRKKVHSVYPEIGEEETQAVLEVMKSTMVTQLEQTLLFEEEISKYIGCKYTTVLNSGTSALISALWAHGIMPHDVVAVPSYTYIATANAITAVGAIPKFMDCAKDTFNVDLPFSPEIFPEKSSLAPEVYPPSRHTKAAVIVDVAGMPCDLDVWNKYCKEHDLILIEDACEAFGAQYKDRKVGNDEHTVVFSFNITKPLQTIEGGAICTNDPEIDERVKLIRRQGQDLDLVVKTGEYHHTYFGLNFRTTDIQSAIGRVQLRKIDKFLTYRREIAEAYQYGIADAFNSNSPATIWWQEVPEYVRRHPFFMCLMVSETQQLRDKILNYLRSKGIQVRICWKPVHLQPVYSFGPYAGAILLSVGCVPDPQTVQLPHSEWLYQHSLSLPTGNAIPKEDVLYVINSILEALH